MIVLFVSGLSASQKVSLSFKPDISIFFKDPEFKLINSKDIRFTPMYVEISLLKLNLLSKKRTISPFVSAGPCVLFTTTTSHHLGKGNGIHFGNMKDHIRIDRFGWVIGVGLTINLAPRKR